MTEFLNTLQLTLDQRYVLQCALEKVWEHLRPNKCFDNAMLVCMHDDSRRLCYVEGHIQNPACVGDKPFAHAWLTLDGVIVDPSLYLTHWPGPINYQPTKVMQNATVSHP